MYLSFYSKAGTSLPQTFEPSGEGVREGAFIIITISYKSAHLRFLFSKDYLSKQSNLFGNSLFFEGIL